MCVKIKAHPPVPHVRLKEHFCFPKNSFTSSTLARADTSKYLSLLTGTADTVFTQDVFLL